MNFQREQDDAIAGSPAIGAERDTSAGTWGYRVLAAIGRRYPLYSGSMRVERSWLFRNLARPRKAVAWCPGPGGLMLVPLDDFVGRCIYFTGDLDRKVSWVCRRIVRPGDTVFDVGANMGVITLLLARCAGAHGIVHAFEPNPRMAALLTQSAARNHFGNIELHQIALGANAGILELRVPRDNAGKGSLVRHRTAPDCDVVQAPVRRLSGIVSEYGIKNIRFIKIDVEGFENEVLLGANEILEKVRPDIILFEANETPEIPFSRWSVVQTLRGAGYRLMALPKSALSMRAVPIDAESQGPMPSYDILAVPEEKYLDVSLRLSASRTPG